MRAARVAIGPLSVDAVTHSEALDEVERLVAAGEGGAVFTPNVDHVVIADEDERMRAAYDDASLSLVDGTPLVWATWLLGRRVPEKVSGSDLVPSLLARAADRGWRVFFLGGAPGVAALARDKAVAQLPSLRIVGVEAPRIDLDAAPAEIAAVVDRVRAERPDVVMVALGAPKQEIFIHRVKHALRPAVLLGVGASLDFVAGTVPRAPRWMSRAGLEWLFRLSREPRRLWRRYLVRDPKFLLILGRMMVERRQPRG